jgi:hypothetical protein
MTVTIHISRDVSCVAQAPRRVGKDFEINRDLVTNPIVVGEVLQLGFGFEADLLVIQTSNTTPFFVVVDPFVQYGLDVTTKLAELVLLGWTVER